MAYSWQSDIIRPDGENGTEVLDTNGVYQPQIEGGDNITIEDGKINASGTLENVQASWSETNPSDPSYIKNKPDLSIYATASGMETALAGKQDTISDLATIRSGAEAGSTAVQPGDLATVATTGSYTSLTNTPQNIVQDASYVHTDNNFTNADKSKLDGIAAGAEVNVQANWNEADPSSDAYIANKPTIPAAQQNADWEASSGVTAILNKPDLSAYATDSELTSGLATKQNVISDLDSIRAGAAAGATAAQPSDLPSSDELVPSATSGDSGKVLTVDSQGNPGWVTPSAGTVYTPGDGIDITNDVISADVDGTTIGIDSTTKKIKSLQVIPTKTSDLQNDSNFVVASSLATVATSGSYADLSNKPTIPSVDQTYNASSTNAQSGTAVAQAIAAIPAPSVDEVPDVTSSDDGKVLTAEYSGGIGSYSWQPASGGGSSYTAGTAIGINNDAISVLYDGYTMGTMYPTHDYFVFNVSSSGTSLAHFATPAAIKTILTTGSSLTYPVYSFKVKILDGQLLYFSGNYTSQNCRLCFGTDMSFNTRIYYTSSNISMTYDSSSNRTYIDAHEITISPIYNHVGYVNPGWSSTSWSSSSSPDYFTFILGDNVSPSSYVTTTSPSNPYAMFTSANGTDKAQLYTKGIRGTTSIYDIAVVDALPEYPINTTLYLIPET